MVLDANSRANILKSIKEACPCSSHQRRGSRLRSLDVASRRIGQRSSSVAIHLHLNLAYESFWWN